MTLADSAIKILLQFCALLAVVLNLQQMFPFAAVRNGHGIG